MSKASLSTGIGRTYQWCEGMEERRAADAIAEARMLVERNDRGWYCDPWERHNATCALAEALAAFVAE